MCCVEISTEILASLFQVIYRTDNKGQSLSIALGSISWQLGKRLPKAYLVRKHSGPAVLFLRHSPSAPCFHVSRPGQSMRLTSLDVQGMLPENLSHFYRYPGSLTTPPCSESVIWTVFDSPIILSPTQVKLTWWLKNYFSSFTFVPNLPSPFSGDFPSVLNAAGSRGGVCLLGIWSLSDIAENLNGAVMP